MGIGRRPKRGSVQPKLLERIGERQIWGKWRHLLRARRGSIRRLRALRTLRWHASGSTAPCARSRRALLPPLGLPSPTVLMLMKCL